MSSVSGVAVSSVGCVGLVGSRGLGPCGGLVSAVVRSCASAGFSFASGCASGADSLCVSAVLSAGLSPLVFAVGSSSGSGFWRSSSPLASSGFPGCSVRWLAGGSLSVPLVPRLRARSLALVSFLSSCSRSALVGFVWGGPVRSPGSWLSLRAAVSAGVPVVVFPVGCSVRRFARFGRGRWVVAGSGVWSRGFVWVPAPDRADNNDEDWEPEPPTDHASDNNIILLDQSNNPITQNVTKGR